MSRETVEKNTETVTVLDTKSVVSLSTHLVPVDDVTTRMGKIASHTDDWTFRVS